MTERTVGKGGAIDRRLRETAVVSRFALGRRDGAAVAALGGLGYLAGFLWATNSLNLRAGTGVSLTVVDDPLARTFDRRGPTSFEAVAVVDAWFGTLLIAPVDLALGVGLAALVGLNLALSYLAVVQPASCGVGAGAGLAAAVPALLSGTVCCAPVILLVIGIQASGTLLTALPLLLPVGVALLLASLVYVAGRIDLAAVAGATPAARGD